MRPPTALSEVRGKMLKRRFTTALKELFNEQIAKCDHVAVEAGEQPSGQHHTRTLAEGARSVTSVQVLRKTVGESSRKVTLRWQWGRARTMEPVSPQWRQLRVSILRIM